MNLMAISKKDTANKDTIPLPDFDRDDFIDRGYYIVSQFRDEKRRRDRAAAVAAARAHPNYVCLMTPDNRLLHRNVYRREHIPLFLELHGLISTWSTPQYFIMGYPIEISNLLEGIHCYQRMGQTCNKMIDDVEYSTYLGCPRASISMKYMHPRSWYSLYTVSEEDPTRFLRKAPPSAEPEPEPEPEPVRSYSYSSHRAPPTNNRKLTELTQVNRQYCGCPLVNARRLDEIVLKRFPEEITAGEGIWHIAPDVMDQKSLQPRSKSDYYALLDSVGFSDLPSSERPDAGRVDPESAEETPKEEEVVEDLPPRRRRMAKYTWLLDE